jgi:hypothetical protein
LPLVQNQCHRTGRVVGGRALAGVPRPNPKNHQERSKITPPTPKTPNKRET